MAWQDAIGQTINGLGFDLVELTRSPGGLLSITIDVPYVPGQPQRFITVEDCERVTRQLQYLLDVEQVDYKRLEVGSPGIDRPLRTPLDFQRFEGELVDVTLKAPIGATGTGVAANRKKFRGTLQATDSPEEWQVVWSEEPRAKPGQRLSKKQAAAPLQALRFSLAEIREARLAPVVNFNGRAAKAPPPPPPSNPTETD